MKFLIESKSKDMLGIEPREKAQMFILIYNQNEKN